MMVAARTKCYLSSDLLVYPGDKKLNLVMIVILVKMDQRVRTQAQGPQQRAKGDLRKDQEGDHPPWKTLALWILDT